MTYRYSGPIAFEGLHTLDGRLVVIDALTWVGLAPVYREHRRLLGLITAVRREVQPDGTVALVADADLEHPEPDVLPCGVELGDAESAQVDEVMVFTAGRIGAVVVYSDPQVPAWPGARLVRAR